MSTQQTINTFFGQRSVWSVEYTVHWKDHKTRPRHDRYNQMVVSEEAAYYKAHKRMMKTCARYEIQIKPMHATSWKVAALTVFRTMIAALPDGVTACFTVHKWQPKTIAPPPVEDTYGPLSDNEDEDMDEEVAPQ